MSFPQQKFREIVFQFLYSHDIAHSDLDQMVEMVMEELAVSKKNVKLAQVRAAQIRALLPEIDPMIARAAVSYDLDRIQKVTLNVLRLGVYELFYDDAIPPKVAISEAMRLSRKFCSPESTAFVNALLDNLYKASIGETANQSDVQAKAEQMLQSDQAIADIEIAHEDIAPEDKD